jgi:hypothetical protein
MTTNPTKGFSPSTDLLNASPNVMFTYFLFSEWHEFIRLISTPPPNFDIDAATGILLSTCTDRDKREEFQKAYHEKKAELKSATSAAIYVSGDFFQYVAESCEFVEKSYGGIA